MKTGLALAVTLCCVLVLGLAGCSSETGGTAAVQTTATLVTQNTSPEGSTTSTTQTPTTKSPSNAQSVQDAAGDAQSLTTGGKPREGQFAALGDIETVQLELRSDSLMVQIQTVDGVPTALPEGETALTFLVEIVIDQNTSYALHMSQLGGGWMATILDLGSLGDGTPGAAPSIVGDTLTYAIPLSSMPGFAPSFQWRVNSAWMSGFDAIGDDVPDVGDDPSHPAMLRFPPT